MARIITFSRTFPSYHPRAGEPTYFVEKVYNSLGSTTDWSFAATVCPYELSKTLNYDMDDKKHHTIRAGHRWKVGDKFSPRVWSGKPYNSKQIQFAPDIEIKRVWDFEIRDSDNGILWINKKAITVDKLEVLAKNDGLNSDDLLAWFQYPKDFDGQIISWDDSIEY